MKSWSTSAKTWSSWRISASSQRKLSERLAGQRRLEEVRELLGALRVGVVAEEDAAHLARGSRPSPPAAARGSAESAAARSGSPSSPSPGRGRAARAGRAPRGSARRSPRRAAGSGFAGGLDHEQHVAGGDLLALARAHLLHDAGDRRVEADLHLHRLEQAERLTGRDASPACDVDRDDHRGRARAHLARDLPAEAVGPPLDLDAHARLRRVVEQAQRAAPDLEARGVQALLAERRGDDAPVEVHAVAPGADRVDLELVALAAVGEVDVLALRRAGCATP